MKPRTKPRTLFILKYRHQSGGSKTLLKHSGLFNSAMFVHEMLLANGYDSRLVQVIDNNEIDRQVTLNKPDVVIIEALWVVPEKFEVLRKLHPNVKWIIRLHSELPFLSNEGIAMDWINRYVVQPNVFVSANSERAQRDLSKYLAAHANTELKDKLVYLPNYYPTSKNAVGSKLFVNGDTINVGCFGAIRPMKNHLLQAAAAVQYAEKHGLRCNFHINAGRVEARGDEVLKNLRAFFDGLGTKHNLVEHGWLDRRDFLQLVKTMDIGLQASLSETFNIVSADFVSQDVPIVTSSEVSWMPKFFVASPTDTESIVCAMERTLFYDRHFIWTEWQWRAMKKYVTQSERVWLHTLPKFLI
jgi:hypothetical protein